MVIGVYGFLVLTAALLLPVCHPRADLCHLSGQICATYQCRSVPPIRADLCHLSGQICATYQCRSMPLSGQICATYQGRSVPPIRADLCHYQGRSVPPIRADLCHLSGQICATYQAASLMSHWGGSNLPPGTLWERRGCRMILMWQSLHRMRLTLNRNSAKTFLT